MSITFYPDNDWSMVERSCDYCPEAKCSPGNPDPEHADPWCTGSIREPGVPTCNFANGNATALLRLIGVKSPGPCGEITGALVPEIQRGVIAARNSRKRRLPHDADAYDVGGPGTGHCRVISFGNTDDQTMRRLDYFQEFLDYCKAQGCGFYWG